MTIKSKRLLPLIFLAIVVLLGNAGFSSADEPAPTKAEAKAPARIFLDQAKTLRLAKLLENLFVLDELNITDEAFTQLENVKGDERVIVRRQSDALSREMKAAQGLPVAERAERMRIFMSAIQAARDAGAETLAVQRFNILTGPQMERLNQLDLQDQGIGAFYDEDVDAALQLTGDQEKKLEDLRVAYEPKFQMLLKGPLVTEATVVRSTQPEVIELLKERTAKVENLLTKEQIEKLAELHGPVFQLSRLGRTLGEMPDRDLAPPRISPMLQSLLEFEAVRQDLKLTPEVEAGINAAIAKHQQSIREVFGPAAQASLEVDDAKLSAVKQALKREVNSTSLSQKSRQLAKEYTDELSKQLKDSHLARLKQINWQRGLQYALMSEGRDEIGFTLEQSQKMMSIRMESMRAQLSPALPPNPEAARDFFAKQIELRKEQQKKEDARLLEILTPEQRQKLKELQGPPFDVSLLDPPHLLPGRPLPTGAKPPATEDKPKAQP